MKKVLIISYNFPPQMTVAARRMGKYCKYFESFGWHPVVLTVKNSEDPLSDISFYDEVKNKITLYQAWDLFSLNLFRKKLIAKSEMLSMPEKRQKGKLSAMFNMLYIRLVRILLLDNQNRIGWLLPALLKSLQIIRREKIDLIYTCPLPYSSNLAGFILNRLTKIPWVAESRGPWILDITTPLYRTVSSNLFNEWVSKITLENCSAFFAGTPRIMELFKAKFNKYRKKIHCAVGGYDEEDFKGDDPPKNKDEFVITYTGTFYSPFQLECFLAAARKSLDAVPEMNKSLKIKFLSILTKSSFRYKIIEKYGLQNIIELYPIMPLKECINYIRSSDVLLFSQVPSPWSKIRLGTKTFDYIRSGKPILALVSLDGGAAALINETRTGVAIDLFDIEGIKKAILQFYEMHRNGRLKISSNVDEIHKYSVANSVRIITRIMNEVSGQGEHQNGL